MNDEVVVVTQDRARSRTGWVGDPVQVVAAPRHNQQPTGSVTVLSDDPKVGLLLQDGARVQVSLRGEHLIGGRVTSWRTEGTVNQRTVTFEVCDDWERLAGMLAWPVPGSPVTDQSAAEYRELSGPCESVVKTLVAENATRLGLPVTVAPDQGRGEQVSVRARMDVLADLVAPLADTAGIGIAVVADQAGWTVDCYVPQRWPTVLSEAGRTVTDVQVCHRRTTATRVVVGCDREGVERTFRAVSDPGREHSAGVVAEVFVDARDLKSDEATFDDSWRARAEERLAAGAAASGVALTLAESQTVRYGGPRGMHVGDTVTVDIGGGTLVTDVLRSATLSWSRDGTTVTPVVGQRTDDPDTTLAASVAALARALRQQQTRR